ncbi:MAG: Bax protein [Paraglaciecola sp.]|jgi:Bax protein
MPDKIVFLLLLVISLLATVLYFSFYQEEQVNKKVLEDTSIEVPDVEPVIAQAAKIIVKEDETHNIPVPDFSSYKDVVKKKKAFFAYLLPEIKTQNNLVRAEREQVLAIHERVSQGHELQGAEQDYLDELRLKYRVAEDLSNKDASAELIKRVDIIPAELILVQAANESGWGTSRFAQKGYNFFGLWCFTKDCGFVPKRRNKGTVHEVAKFRDLSQAIKTYLHNLNRHYAYEPLREIRYQQRQANQPITAKAMVQGLKSYSERGTEYIDELLSMMRVNKKHMGL